MFILRIFVGAFVLLVCSGVSEAEPVFQVRPPELKVPSGVPAGAYRRTVHPFTNWTLVCDDNLAEKRRTCDIRQDIQIKGAGVIFSWALTASDAGTPVMRMKAPHGVGTQGSIRITFSDQTVYTASVTKCDGGVCEAIVPVGPKLRQHIQNQSDVQIEFVASPVGRVSFKAPMAGLASALKAAE